jgi:ATP-binding cassette, subfamily C (CFTR/MRP), member 1
MTVSLCLSKFKLLTVHVARSEGKFTLPLVLLQTLARPFRAVIAPRGFLILFRYAQPILIRLTIRFISNSYAENSPRVKGFWIFVSAYFVYSGLAVRIRFRNLFIIDP